MSPSRRKPGNYFILYVSAFLKTKIWRRLQQGFHNFIIKQSPWAQKSCRTAEATEPNFVMQKFRWMTWASTMRWDWATENQPQIVAHRRKNDTAHDLKRKTGRHRLPVVNFLRHANRNDPCKLDRCMIGRRRTNCCYQKEVQHSMFFLKCSTTCRTTCLFVWCFFIHHGGRRITFRVFFSNLISEWHQGVFLGEPASKPKRGNWNETSANTSCTWRKDMLKLGRAHPGTHPSIVTSST